MFRDNKSAHALISRTTAKQTYLLQDCDFDMRQPPLAHIVRRNPHRQFGGDMRLYLEAQVSLGLWNLSGALTCLKYT